MYTREGVSTSGETAVILNGILLIIAALLLVYLVYAMLRPEKF